MAQKKTLKFKFNAYKNVLIILFAFILLSIGIAVYSFNCTGKIIELTAYKKGIYVVSIDSKYFAENSEIYVADTLETVEDAAVKSNAKIAINVGFFDPNNKKTISYILKNNEIIENPENNESLTGSTELKPYLEKIYNRAELRLLSCQNEINFDIKQHNEPVDENCGLVYSIQAGPELVPSFDAEKEFFVLKKNGKVVRQSASALQKFARSAIGFKKDRVLLVAVSNEAAMTLKELSVLMKNLGAEKALAFDGGSSTSLYADYNLIGAGTDKHKFILNSAKDNTARRVKSILILK